MPTTIKIFLHKKQEELGRFDNTVIQEVCNTDSVRGTTLCLSAKTMEQYTMEWPRYAAFQFLAVSFDSPLFWLTSVIVHKNMAVSTRKLWWRNIFSLFLPFRSRQGM